MSSGEYLLCITGMGLVTYLPRWLPLASLSRRELPPWVVEWLERVPVAVLAALVAPVLFTSGVPRQVDLARPEPWIAVPTLLFAWKTRSLSGTVILGMFLYWVAEKWF